MSILHAVLLGLVEGLTELLPVSSTGHLILLDKVLSREGDAAKALDIVIQLGAVAAIALYFRGRLAEHLRGLVARRPDSVRLWTALAIAFVPAAALGLATHRWIKEHLFGPRQVAAGLVAGALVMLAADAWQRRRRRHDQGLGEVGGGRAAVIGLCQCASLWPGASRSMTTIVGGQLTGLDTRTAAEFSFLLALPTLGAATLYELYKDGRTIAAAEGGAATLAVGTGVSFAVTWLVVAVFLRYVSRVGLWPFAIYRLALGAAVLYWSGR